MIYVLEQLQAMPDGALNALAARVHGWSMSFGTWEAKDGGSITCELFCANDGAVIPVNDYLPIIDRNQSGELLTKMVEQGCEFVIHHWKSMSTSIHWRDSSYHFYQYVPGNNARAETIAAILAWQSLRENSR